MSRWAGYVGFGITTNSNGVYTETITEHPYKGDEIKSTYKWQQSNKVNDDFTINKQISIIADSFAYDNIGTMKYVTILGQKWKITSFEPQYPRIILTVGGVWNGD